MVGCQAFVQKPSRALCLGCGSPLVNRVVICRCCVRHCGEWYQAADPAVAADLASLLETIRSAAPAARGPVVGPTIVYSFDTLRSLRNGSPAWPESMAPFHLVSQRRERGGGGGGGSAGDYKRGGDKSTAGSSTWYGAAVARRSAPAAGHCCLFAVRGAGAARLLRPLGVATRRRLLRPATVAVLKHFPHRQSGLLDERVCFSPLAPLAVCSRVRGGVW